jgi:futalosine hydrolase
LAAKKTIHIGILSTVPAEGTLFTRKLKSDSKNRAWLPKMYTGRLCNQNVIFSLSGIGKTNAAHTATLLIRDYSPYLVIHCGVGGAYPSAGLAVGDIAVATGEVYGDEGVETTDGFHGTDFLGIPLLKKQGKTYFNEFPLDKKLAERAVNSSQAISTVKSGIFVTISTCSGKRKKARKLQKKYNALCESMEGAAIAHICAMYGVPLIELRGISNIVEDRDTATWDIQRASENCQKAVMNILRSLDIN